jgi:hypothetical protein
MGAMRFFIAVWSANEAESRRMNPQKVTIAILTALSVSLALADDFKTYDGKEYKNARVRRVEADGIVVSTKVGISKLYFTELPKDVQERFHYNPETAAAAHAAEAAAIQQTNEQMEDSRRQQKEQQNQQGERAAKQQNIQALANTYQSLLQQEEALLVQIGQIKNVQEIARRKYVNGFYTSDSHLTDTSEANLPLLEGRLQNVRDEKQRVREELEQAQRGSR